MPYVPSDAKGIDTIHVPRGCERIVIATSLDRRTERPSGFQIEKAGKRMERDEAPELELCFLPGMEGDSGEPAKEHVIRTLEEVLRSAIRSLEDGSVGCVTLVGVSSWKRFFKVAASVSLSGWVASRSWKASTTRQWRIGR